VLGLSIIALAYSLVRRLFGRGHGSAPDVPQYCRLGLPLDPRGWAMQDAIDGGKLRSAWRRLGFAANPEAIVDEYLRAAREDRHAVVMLELWPTRTTQPVRDVAFSVLHTALGRPAPHLANDDDVAAARVGSSAIARALRAQGYNVYAIAVPYANTLSNVLGRMCWPCNGTEQLHKYLARLRGVRTVAAGLSQGGTVVLDYVARFGASDGLTWAFAAASMGGADLRGGHGVFRGVANGVPVVSLAHRADPARVMDDSSLASFVEGLLTFVDARRQAARGLDVSVHTGLNRAARRGCVGYPVEQMSPHFEGLFRGLYDRESFHRAGEWTHDLRRSSGTHVAQRPQRLSGSHAVRRATWGWHPRVRVPRPSRMLAAGSGEFRVDNGVLSPVKDAAPVEPLGESDALRDDSRAH
jgi:hypothetical protein